MTPTDALDLADYRRRVSELYAAVRAAAPGADAHTAWIDGRDRLFRSHPQSAVPREERSAFVGLDYWPYDASLRVAAPVVGAARLGLEIAHTGDGTTRFTRVGRVEFALRGTEVRLDLFWLDAYGGGLFLPFRDATNGGVTYGGGRYLLDTVKGADLGRAGDDLILDFNYAYHPSCVYSSRWSCPLAPPGNRVDVAIDAGERLRSS